MFESNCGTASRRQWQDRVHRRRAMSVSVLHVHRLQLLQWTLHHHRVSQSTVFTSRARTCSLVHLANVNRFTNCF